MYKTKYKLHWDILMNRIKSYQTLINLVEMENIYMDYSSVLNTVINQEKELLFDHFSNDDAFELGMILYNLAKEKNLPVTIEITKNTQIVFHVALPGTAQDNDTWLARKAKLVTRMGKSSFRIGLELKKDGISLEEAYGLTLADYAAHGGCFPVNLKNTGIIGTIGVSGLEQSKDHDLVIEGIKKWLYK